LNKRYPVTEILKFGPSSSGMFEKCARRGTDREFMLDRRPFSNEIPSPEAVDTFESSFRYTGASASVGEVL
jgi:hypothetical protein